MRWRSRSCHLRPRHESGIRVSPDRGQLFVNRPWADHALAHCGAPSMSVRQPHLDMPPSRSRRCERRPHHQASLRALAKRYGINQKTVAKWKGRTSVADVPTGPKEPRSTVLSIEEEAVVVAFRRHTLLPLDDCLYPLQPTIPRLTRSSLHRCPQRHGVSRLPWRKATKSRGGSSRPIRSVSSRRHRRSANREGQALSLRRHRSNFQVRGRSLVHKANMQAARLPAGPCRRRALQGRDRAHRQWNPIRRPAKEPIRPNRQVPRPSFRPRLSGTRDRTSTDQAQSSLDH